MSQDTRVNELMEKVEAQRKALGAEPRFSPITNAKFHFDKETYFNLHVQTDICRFVRALAMLLEQSSHHQTACERLGLDIPFLWYGYSLEDWETDFKGRIAALQWRDRKKQLDATERKLAELLSEEGKTSKALDEIAGLLG